MTDWGRHLVWGATIGAATLSVALAVAALAGVATMEYKARPWEHAAMLGCTGACWGILPGAVLGLLVWWLRPPSPPTND
jgi:hypothetical protein